MKTVVYILGLLVLLLQSCSKSKTEEMRKNESLWASQARDAITKRGEADSALMLNIRIIKSINTRGVYSSEDRLAVCKAYNNIAMIQMFYREDYGNALNNLLKASEYCDYDSIQATIDYNFGNIFAFFASCLPAESNVRDSRKYLLRAYRNAVKTGRIHVALGAAEEMWRQLLTNPGDTAWLRHMPDFGNDLKKVLAEPEYRNSKLWYDAARLAIKGNSKEAIDILQRHSTVDTTMLERRREAVRLWQIGRLYQWSGKHDSALIYGEKTYGIARPLKLTDLEAATLRLMGESMRAIGYREEANANLVHYHELRDSLLFKRNLLEVDKGIINHDLELSRQKSELLSQRVKSRNYVIIIVALFIILLIIFAIVILRKNRLLKQRARLLYDRHHLLTQQEKRLDILAPCNEEKVKYAGSNISAKERADIESKIKVLIQDVSLICSPEFSLNDLSEAVGVNAKKVSQVLNEKYGCTFAALLSEMRCRQACRMFDDPRKSNSLTIEGIGIEVGFRSRQGFVRAFKQAMGMTPSEYKRLSKTKE